MSSPGSSHSNRKTHNARTGVFIDVEDYPFPESLDSDSIYEKIKSSLEEKGYGSHVSIYLFADEKKRELMKQYRDVGIITLVPEVAGAKNVRLHRLIFEVLVFALHTREDAKLLVLSKSLKEERLAIDSLKGLHSRGYKVFISEPTSELRLFTESESSDWIWTILLDGGGNPSLPSGSGSSQHVDKKRKSRASSTDSED